ncbi:hypothetical protein BJX64DRAFT_188972 [Aspergillus heterothallicus]
MGHGACELDACSCLPPPLNLPWPAREVSYVDCLIISMRMFVFHFTVLLFARVNRQDSDGKKSLGGQKLEYRPNSREQEIHYRDLVIRSSHQL